MPLESTQPLSGTPPFRWSRSLRRAPVATGPFGLPFGAVDSALMDALPVAVYVCDREARIVGFNRRAVELWGRDPSPGERFCGSLRMIRPDGSVLPHHECPMADVLQTGEAVRDAGVIVERPDGSRVTVSVTIVPLTDATGHVAGAVDTFQDVGELQRLDDAVSRRELELHDFVENATEGLQWAGPDGVILWANQAELDLLGYSRDEYIGHHIAEFHLDREVIDDILARLWKNESVREGESRLRCKDGSIRHVLINSNVLWRDGEFVHTRCFTRDITERKRAEDALRESEERLAAELAAMRRLQETSTQLIREDDVGALYEQILDAAVAIMRSDMASMQIVDEAEDALRMLSWRGFEPEFGKTFELNRPDTKTSCSVARRLHHRVVVPDVETCDFIVGTAALEDHRKTGIRAVQSTPLVSRSGQVLGMISTHWRQPHQPSERDLRLLDLLARQAADLMERTQAETAVRESEVQLRRASQMLEEAVRAREEFLSMASHELRNPVNALQLQLVALLRAMQEDDRPVAREWASDRIGQAVAAVRRLARLVETLLDVSRITAGRLDLEPEEMDLGQSVHAVVDRFKEQLKERQITMGVAPLIGSWDRFRLEQVVTNLVSNGLSTATDYRLRSLSRAITPRLACQSLIMALESSRTTRNASSRDSSEPSHDGIMEDLVSGSGSPGKLSLRWEARLPSRAVLAKGPRFV